VSLPDALIPAALSEDDVRHVEKSRRIADERRQAFVSAIPAELITLDDNIERQLAREPASLKSKLGKVYRIVDGGSAVAAPYVACRNSCSACCKMNVVITSLEAERLAAVSGRKLHQVSAPIRHPEGKFSGMACPFLDKDSCSVYDSRPYACRAHFTFDEDSYWCQPERSGAAAMPMVRFDGARQAYQAIAEATKLGGFADIRDFFPS